MFIRIVISQFIISHYLSFFFERLIFSFLKKKEAKYYKLQSPQINMEQHPDQQISFLLTDFNTRLRDLEERNKLIKDRTLLLGKNLITTREQFSEDIQELKKQATHAETDIQALKRLAKSILRETEKFVRRDEILVLERMLKDFQPLEFMRKKDVEELINQKLKPTKKSVK